MRYYLIDLTQQKDTFATRDGRVFLWQPSADFSEIAVVVDKAEQLYAMEVSQLPLDHRNSLPTDLVYVPFRALIADLSIGQANQMARGMQLLRFLVLHQYCGRCGSKNIAHPADNARLCPSCQLSQYPQIQPCTITAIIKQVNNRPHILLAHHHRAKDSGMYGLIAGFVEVGESLEQCVHREVAEEVGLTVNNLRYISSQPWPFPSNLMLGFVADYGSGDIVIEENELIHADFFDFDHLPIIPPKGTIAHELIHWVKANA